MHLAIRLGVCAGALLLFGQWSEAATVRTSRVGGWTITVEADDGTRTFTHCRATNTVGGATLAFNVTRTLQWSAEVENSVWKFPPDGKFEVYFALDPQTDGPMFRYGAKVDGERRFAAVITENAGPEHELYVALRRGRSLTIVVDDKVNPNVVFELSRTFDALPALMRCVAQYRKITGPMRLQRPQARPATGEPSPPAPGR